MTPSPKTWLNGKMLDVSICLKWEIDLIQGAPSVLGLHLDLEIIILGKHPKVDLKYSLALIFHSGNYHSTYITAQTIFSQIPGTIFIAIWHHYLNKIMFPAYKSLIIAKHTCLHNKISLALWFLNIPLCDAGKYAKMTHSMSSTKRDRDRERQRNSPFFKQTNQIQDCIRNDSIFFQTFLKIHL